MSTPCTVHPGTIRSLSPTSDSLSPSSPLSLVPPQNTPKHGSPKHGSPKHGSPKHCSPLKKHGSSPKRSSPRSHPPKETSSKRSSLENGHSSPAALLNEEVGEPSKPRKSSHVTNLAQSLLSPMFARKSVKPPDADRSGFQSPLISKRSEKMPNGIHIRATNGKVSSCHMIPDEDEEEEEEEKHPGLPGGDATVKKPSKWKLKMKSSETDKISETSSYSSNDSSRTEVIKSPDVLRANSKRKKLDEAKKCHSRGSSFDYRLIKDMFKISLPRSRSAGELPKEDAEPGEKKEKKVKSSKSTKLKNSFKGKESCSTLPDEEAGLSALHQGTGRVGLKNLGNTCFMNSILQCLSHSAPLREYFLSRKYKGDLSSSSKMQGRLAEEFANLLSDMWSGRMDTCSPNKFKSAVAKSAPRFVGYSQQDSQEFLRFFMEGLHEDLNRGKRGKRRMEEPEKDLSDSQLADHRWKEYLTWDNSEIVSIFVGLLKSTLTCSICDHKSVTFDPFWDLSLPLPRSKGSGLNLYSCFAEFTQVEVLDGDEMPTCENCKKRQKCTKQFSIERFPPILVLHLKRFSEVRYRTKLSTKVDFPVENLDLADFSSSSACPPQYDLVGVSNHSGNTFSGHYIAFCKSGERWHRYSDTSVSSLSKSDIVSSEAYVLFYERKR